MAKVTSRIELEEYCLRALGAPVLEINIDEDQLDDRVDEALEYFQDYHSDFTEKYFLFHEVTQEDIDNKYIPISDLITSVVRLHPIRHGTGSSALFDIEYHMRKDILDVNYMGSLLNYQMTLNHLALIEDILSDDDKHINFDRHKNELRIDMDWESEVVVGNFLIVECYRIIDPEMYTDVYNDRLLKKYCTALIKRQWGINLVKFEGMQLPGGVTFSGRETFSEALEEITTLEETIRLEYEKPIDFFMG